MGDDGVHELHVTGFDVEAGVRYAGLGGNVGPGVPLVALEIEGRPRPDARDESLWLRLTVDIARALAAELIQEADHAEQLARRHGDASQN
ncbi:hypothetical protein ACFPJ1_08145 [Kribbella qitaiheensis]|uniref:hypothetical protein n=1 Tax=Kribbella qitaiheensis TaxID=1544730 RepID=UPI00360D1BF4